jgi:Fe-Mn family superoxide dismutase
MGNENTDSFEQVANSKYPFELPPLPYGYDTLAPVVDAETMQLHHDKHHQTYVDKLNEALKDQTDLHNKTLTELLLDLSSVPDAARTAVRNHGGGHLNHSMFWEILKFGGEENKPSGALAQAIDRDFGSFDEFKEKFNDAGAKLFGSGWVFVVADGGTLKIKPMPNQDNPLLEGQKAIIGNDVWEHAYYVTYRNRRPEYLKAWWKVVNWDKASEIFEKASA